MCRLLGRSGRPRWTDPSMSLGGERRNRLSESHLRGRWRCHRRLISKATGAATAVIVPRVTRDLPFVWIQDNLSLTQRYSNIRLHLHVIPLFSNQCVISAIFSSNEPHRSKTSARTGKKVRPALLKWINDCWPAVFEASYQLPRRWGLRDPYRRPRWPRKICALLP